MNGRRWSHGLTERRPRLAVPLRRRRVRNGVRGGRTIRSVVVGLVMKGVVVVRYMVGRGGMGMRMRRGV